MEYITIGELLKNGDVEITTGPFGTQLKASEYQPTGTPVLNVKNIGFGTVVTAKLDRVGDETVQRLQRHMLCTGDIVFGRKGAVERHAYITESENGWMQGSDCIRLRVKSDRYNPRFLSYVFMTKRHRDFMISMCSHGTTMASLNQGILEKIVFPCVPIDEQNRIVSVLSAIDNQIVINEQINDNLAIQTAILETSISPDKSLTNKMSRSSDNLLDSRTRKDIWLKNVPSK